MSGIKGLALISHRSGWEQLQRNFKGLIDFSRYVPSLADLREDIASGRLGATQSQIVLVSDNLAQGVSNPINRDNTLFATHLVQTIGNFIFPPASTIPVVPVLILMTSKQESETLKQDVMDFLIETRGESGARNAVAKNLRLIAPSLSEISNNARELVATYPQEGEPTDYLVLDSLATLGVVNVGAPVITCTSAKGGVGKTTTALLFAFSAAFISRKQGKRMNVVIVELDLSSAQIGHIVGADPSAKTILDYVNMSQPTEQALFANLEEVAVRQGAGQLILPEGSIKILYSPHDGGDDNNIKAQHVKEVLTLLRNSPDVDLIVVDTAPELRHDERIKEALMQSNLVMYITQDSKASMGLMTQNLEHMVNDYHLNPEDVKIVINNASRTIDDQSLLADIRQLGGGISPLAVIPRSNAIFAASGTSSGGELFYALFDQNDPEIAGAYTSLFGAVKNYVELEEGAQSDRGESREAPVVKKKGIFGFGGK